MMQFTSMFGEPFCDWMYSSDTNYTFMLEESVLKHFNVKGSCA